VRVSRVVCVCVCVARHSHTHTHIFFLTLTRIHIMFQSHAHAYFRKVHTIFYTQNTTHTCLTPPHAVVPSYPRARVCSLSLSNTTLYTIFAQSTRAHFFFLLILSFSLCVSLPVMPHILSLSHTHIFYRIFSFAFIRTHTNRKRYTFSHTYHTHKLHYLTHTSC